MTHKKGAAKYRSSKRQLFPEKLWDLVNSPGSGVQWSADGCSIEVDKGQFQQVIGTKFRSHNFDSFIRQLHFYGFRKTGNSYYHRKFQRSQPDALFTMKRKYPNADLPINQHELDHQYRRDTPPPPSPPKVDSHGCLDLTIKPHHDANKLNSDSISDTFTNNLSYNTNVSRDENPLPASPNLMSPCLARGPSKSIIRRQREAKHYLFINSKEIA